MVIYAVAGRIDEPRKYAIAIDLLRSADIRISGQVLAEFASNATRKFADAITAEQLDEWLTMLARFPCVPVDADLVRAGVLFSRRYGTSYHDGAVIAAAERLGAPTLYTEDLSHGQRYGSVQAINPFL